VSTQPFGVRACYANSSLMPGGLSETRLQSSKTDVPEYSRNRLAFDSATMRHLAADPRGGWLGLPGTLNNRRHLESSAKLGVRSRTTMRPRAMFSVDSQTLERRSGAMPHLRMITDQGDILEGSSTFRRAAPPSLERRVWPREV